MDRSPAYFERRFHTPDAFRPQDVRSPYERDRGRIVHCAAFRRLQGKTQVMGVGEGDFHRTRLTHSIECAQIGTGILDQMERGSAIPGLLRPWIPARHLMEAACSAHDMGHPPFGHAGEVALFKRMRRRGGFEANAHTLRILTRLEKYKEHQWGVNPTRRLVLAILKYPIPYSAFDTDAPTYAQKPPKCYFDDEAQTVAWAIDGFSDPDLELLRLRTPKDRAKHRTFDCSVVELADDIAYGVHDIEDIVARRLVERDQVGALLKSAFDKIGSELVVNSGSLTAVTVLDNLFRSSFTRKQIASRLVSAFITAVQIQELEEFSHPLLRFRATLPDAHRTLLEELKDMSFRLVIDWPPVRQLERRGRMILANLFRCLATDPGALIPKGNWDDGDSSAAVERRVCDYIAGMTDSYAEKVYRRLFVPGYGSSSDQL